MDLWGEWGEWGGEGEETQTKTKKNPGTLIQGMCVSDCIRQYAHNSHMI